MNVKTIKFADRYIGSAVCGILGLFNRKSEIGKVSNILVLQFWGIGETILTLPALNVLRKRFPKSKITVLATGRNIDVYYKNKDADNIVNLNMGVFSILDFIIRNFRKYDLVVDMEEYLNISSIISFFVGRKRIGFKGKARGKLYSKSVIYNDKQHTVDTFLDLAALTGARAKPKKLVELNYSEQDKAAVERLIKTSKPLIGIAPGAAESAKSRMWFRERFAELADLIIKKYDVEVVFIGNEKEKKLIGSIIGMMENRALNSAGLFSLKQLFYFVKKCRVIISNDAGAMHIAAAQGVKTIGLFGPNTPVRWVPYGDNASVYKQVECSPCINTHLGIVPECKWKKSDKRYLQCMKKIEVKDVLEGFERVF